MSTLLRRSGASLLGLLSIASAACGGTSGGDTDTSSGKLGDELTLGPLCGHTDNDALRQKGITYLDFCSDGTSQGRIVRLDVKTGEQTTVGHYEATEAITFVEADDSYVLWEIVPPSTKSTQIPTGHVTVRLAAWDANLPAGQLQVVSDDLITDYRPDGTSAFANGFLSYAGKGRILAAWGYGIVKVGIIDLTTASIPWSERLPTDRADFFTRSDDGQRYLIRPYNSGMGYHGPLGLVDLSGGAPSFRALDRSYGTGAFFTWDGWNTSFDGKSVVLSHSTPTGTELGRLDVDSGAFTSFAPLGSSYIQWLGQQAFAYDGTFAFYTDVVGPNATRSRALALAANPAHGGAVTRVPVPSTYSLIKYVAPGGAYAVAGEPVYTKGYSDPTSVNYYAVKAGADPVLLGTSFDIDVVEDGGGAVLTLRASGSSKSGKVVRLDAAGAVAVTADLPDAYGLALDATHVLDKGCVGTFDASGVVIDQGLCSGNETVSRIRPSVTRKLLHWRTVDQPARAFPFTPTQMGVLHF